jgi:hypothetical protein
MNKQVGLIVVAGCLAFSSGCASLKSSRDGMADMPPAVSIVDASGLTGDNSAEVSADRMFIWKATLDVEVASVSNAVSQAVAFTTGLGGLVSQKSEQGQWRASLTLKIPAKSFKKAMSGLERLGTVNHREVEGEDVTEQVIDVESRLKNKIALRDRLKQLLDKAVTVKDILTIETELNRVQSDIDSMEGRIKSIRGQVEYATVSLTLHQKEVRPRRILGPLGYLFKGLYWTIEKLFVIRE